MPVVATLDLHANISPRMVELADVLIGYDTYPHIDMAERAEEATAVLARLMRGEIRPTPALRKPPMLPTSQRMTTERMPMRALMERAHVMEEDPRVINVTIAGGFPLGDNPDAGFGIVVTTDDDPDLAAELANELATEAWSLRDGFLGGVASFEHAAELIHSLDSEEDVDMPVSGPLVLVDIADNPWSGGPGDSVELLRFLFAQQVNGAAVALVRDPEVVREAIAAGPGGKIAVDLGGKTDRLHGDPLPVRAHVKLLSDGRYVNDGPMMTGLTVDLGPTALLLCEPAAGPSAPPVEVLVTTRAETPVDLNVFRCHGIEPTRHRVLGLKGKGHFRAAFEPIARRVVLVEGPGTTGADLSRLTFRKVRRPIWPLDPAEAIGFATEEELDAGDNEGGQAAALVALSRLSATFARRAPRRRPRGIRRRPSPRLQRQHRHPGSRRCRSCRRPRRRPARTSTSQPGSATAPCPHTPVAAGRRSAGRSPGSP